MALNKDFSSNIEISASGDQLLTLMSQYESLIGKAIGRLKEMNGTLEQGSNKSENAFRKQAQTLQRLIGEASTLANIFTSMGSKKQTNFLSILDDQSMGKKSVNASKLRQELKETEKASDALGIRLFQLEQRIKGLAQAGQSAGKTDLSRVLQTKQAITDVQRLEKELSKLDARARISGGYKGDALAQRQQAGGAMAQMLALAQNKNWFPKDGYTTNIALVDQLISKLRQQALVEQQAARASSQRFQNLKRETLQRINNSDPSQLRAMAQSGASKFRFTPDQARGFDMKRVNAEVDAGILKLARLADLQSKVLSSPTQGTERNLQRLKTAWEAITKSTAEAMAKQRDYNNLPERKVAAVNEYLFSNKLGTGLRVAGFAALAQVAGTVISSITGSVQAVIQLEDEMAKLQAISGATDSQMVKLASSIQNVAANSRYSTIEITQAATMIAQAGFSASETANVLKDALTLAAASGASPTEAVDTLTSALGAFQLQASESTRVVDVLVQGLNRSKLSIQQMQAAIQYAGATAQENGVRFEELTAIAASLANAGIRSGSTIGTGLRQLLVDLKTPTENFKTELKNVGLTMADVDVRALGLAGVVKKLAESGFSAEQAYSSFEVRAASAFLAFKNQVDVYDDLALSIAQQGAAAEANERAMGSLTAKWQNFKNILLQTGENMAGPTLSAFGALLTALSGIVSAFNAADTALGGFLSTATLVGGAFLINPWLGLATAIAVVVGDLVNTNAALDELKTKTAEAEAELDSQQQTLASLDQALQAVVDRSTDLSGNQKALQAEVLNLTGRFEGLAGQLDTTALSYDGLVRAMLNYRGEQARAAAAAADGTLQAAQDERKGYEESLREQNAKERAIDQRAQSFRNSEAAKDPALKKALDFARQSSKTDVTGWNYNSLFSHSIDITETLNSINKANSTSPLATYLKDYFTDRAAFVQGLQNAAQSEAKAKRDIEIYKETSSGQGRTRDGVLIDTQGAINSALNKNKQAAGSGDADLARVMATTQRYIALWEKQLESLDPSSGRALGIKTSISALNEQLSRGRKAQNDAGADLMKNERAGAGENLTGSSVAALIRSEFKGSNPYSYQKRSYAEQVDLYNKYKAGKGALAAEPGKSKHGSGHALDLTPIPGMKIDQVAAFLESRGVELTEVLNEKHPDTGRFHWHFAWKPKRSQFASRQNSEAEAAAKEMQRLLEEGAQLDTQDARSAIEGFLTRARSGNVDVKTARADLNKLIQNYSDTSLKGFDIQNPVEGATPEKLALIQRNRQALVDKLKTESEGLYDRFWGFIQDAASKTFQAALSAADEAFNSNIFNAEASVRRAERNQGIATNRLNRGQYGAGDEFILEQKREEAQLVADRTSVIAYDDKETQMVAAIAKQREALAGLNPQSEQYTTIVKELRTAEADLLKVQQDRSVLLDKIAIQTSGLNGVTGTFGDRIEGAAQSWLLSSGAMDNWQKTAQDNVGPALANLTEGFTGLFDSVFNGSKSFGAALGDMISSFAKFVQQILMQALALMAVKAILGAFGIDTSFLPGKYDGGVTGGPKMAVAGTNAYNGGPVVTGLQGGGPVTRGMPTRDSALYNLAKDEFVVRNKSVKELGLPFMHAINKHGRRGLDKMTSAGTVQQNIQMPRQETNVFVVQKDQAPSMGPNDVLIAVQNDILQNGATKKLIKQVAQGG